MVISGNLDCCWVFFFYLGDFSTKSFQFFSFGILDIIDFKLALFITTKERAFNT